MSDDARRLLCKVIADKDFTSLTEAGIDDKYFLNAADREVFSALADGVSRYGRMPSVKALQMDFPEYRFVAVDDDTTYLIDRVKRERSGSVLAMSLNAAAELYDAGDYDGSANVFRTGIAELEEVSRTASLRTLDLLGLADKWEEDRKAKIAGIPFGIGAIDHETGGVYSDQLVTLIGPPGSGKSGHMLNMALAAAKRRHRALFITIEMSDEHHIARAVANLSGIPYKTIRKGEPKPTAAQQDKIYETLEELHEDGYLIVQEVPAEFASLATVREQIDKHKPDIVYIDGAYLMQLPDVRPNARQDEQLSALTRTMKSTILKTHTPIVISTQVLESKMQGGEVTTKSVGYSSSFHQDSDIMIGIQPDGEIAERQLIKLLKFRDGEKINVHVQWDWAVYRVSEYGGDVDPHEQAAQMGSGW